MQSAGYVLGVDGGNTKTVALIARLDGTVAGAGRGGCSDIYTNPNIEVPLSEVEKAVSSALEAARIEPSALVMGMFSMAGADWPEDFSVLQAAMEKRGFGRKVRVVNDAVGALHAGLIRGPGVVVVCGTGAAIAARSVEGKLWHSSWWQDPQGGHQLGVKVLHAVYQAELGIGPPTALTTAVLRYFEQDDVEKVLHLFTARAVARPHSGKISGLSRVLLDLAHDGGDPTAVSIIREHGIALGDYALAAARQVGIAHSPFTLVLAGGVLRHPSSLLPEALIARVQATASDVTPVYSRFEPAVGALLLALEEVDVAVDDALLTRLAATLPESPLFVT